MPIVPRSPIESRVEPDPSTPTKLPPIYSASSVSPERKKLYGTSEWAAPFWSNMQVWISICDSFGLIHVKLLLLLLLFATTTTTTTTALKIFFSSRTLPK